MKKISFVSLLSLLFLSLCSFVGYFLRFINFDSFWVPLIFGGFMMIISGIVKIIAKKNMVANIICFFVNAIALGLCLRSWYIFREFDNELWVMLLVSIASVIYLLIFYLLLYIPFFNKHFNVYIWVFLILSFIGYLLVMILTKTTFVSTFGYYMIIEIAFIFAMCRKQETFKQVFLDITVSTYSVIIVAIIMALLMSGADGLDGFDFGGGGEGSNFTSPKNKKIK